MAVMRTWALLLTYLPAAAIVGCGRPSVESCVACGETVSKQATTCPHCGEPNPSQTLRDAIAARLAEEERLKAAEQRKNDEALAILREMETIGDEFLSERGSGILRLGKDDEGFPLWDNHDAQVFAVREYRGHDEDLFNELGRKVVAESRAARAKGNVDRARQILEKARVITAAERAAAWKKERENQVAAAFERLRGEIDRLAKERGTLPDEESVAAIASTGAMRDPFSQPLKYRVLDAQAGKYLLTSVGLDLKFGTDDDSRVEYEVRK